ncbi:hypothetical protein H8E77_28465 [bacterium]|nr:hypothetical protein [bacterium]
MRSDRHTNPIRLTRNIRRIFKLKKNAKSSIKVSSSCDAMVICGNKPPVIETPSPKAKRMYWLPCLKNTILVTIAIALSETFRINEIARCLPISVSDKQKQKRLLRFLDRGYPTGAVMKQWALFVLRKVYQKSKSKVILLIDETDLLFGYKAIVLFHFVCALSLFTGKSTAMSKSKIWCICPTTPCCGISVKT